MYNKQTRHPDVAVMFGHCPVILPEWIALYQDCLDVLLNPDPNEICSVYSGNGHVNVDTECFHSHRLAAYRLDDGECFYSGPVQIRN